MASLLPIFKLFVVSYISDRFDDIIVGRSAGGSLIILNNDEQQVLVISTVESKKNMCIFELQKISSKKIAKKKVTKKASRLNENR